MTSSGSSSPSAGQASSVGAVFQVRALQRGTFSCRVGSWALFQSLADCRPYAARAWRRAYAARFRTDFGTGSK